MQNVQGSWISKNTEETREIARELFDKHADTRLWLLEGNLGAGKTSFVQALVQGASSPTFAYVKEYEALAHYDLYRLEREDPELLELIEEHMFEKAVFIEWPQRMQIQWPKPHVKLSFTVLEDGSREINLQVVQ